MIIKIIFLASAFVLLIIAVYSRKIYDWGSTSARRWGWNKIVMIRESNKHWALPFSKVLLVILAIVCVISAFYFA